MDIYIAPEVADVKSLHPYLRNADFRASPILEQLTVQAATIHAAHANRDSRARIQLGSWWPKASGLSLDQLMLADFNLDDARLTIAREYGFESWAAVEALQQARPDGEFETALDELLDGQYEVLRSRLMARASLTTAPSSFGHRATLLHYIGANGVESHRQQTPLNAPKMAELLIAHGARRDAVANMYGGGQTPFDLASTSAHPHQAGVSKELNDVLRV